MYIIIYVVRLYSHVASQGRFERLTGVLRMRGRERDGLCNASICKLLRDRGARSMGTLGRRGFGNTPVLASPD